MQHIYDAQVFSQHIHTGSAIPVIMYSADEWQDVQERVRVSQMLRTPSVAHMLPLDDGRFEVDFRAPNGESYAWFGGDGAMAAAATQLFALEASGVTAPEVELVLPQIGESIFCRLHEGKVALDMPVPGPVVQGCDIPDILHDRLKRTLGLDAYGLEAELLCRNHQYYGLRITGPDAVDKLRLLNFDRSTFSWLNLFAGEERLYDTNGVLRDMASCDGVHIYAADPHTGEVVVRSLLGPKGIDEEVLCGSGNAMLAPYVLEQLHGRPYTVHGMHDALGSLQVTELRQDASGAARVTLHADVAVIQELVKGTPLSSMQHHRATYFDSERAARLSGILSDTVIPGFKHVLRSSSYMPDGALLAPDDIHSNAVHADGKTNHLFGALVEVFETPTTPMEQVHLLRMLREKDIMAHWFADAPSLWQSSLDHAAPYPTMLDWLQDIALTGERAMEDYYSDIIVAHAVQEGDGAMQNQDSAYALRKLIKASGFPYLTYHDLASTTLQSLHRAFKASGLDARDAQALLSEHSVMAFYGAGPLPLEALYIHLMTGTQILCINDDAKATQDGTELIRALEACGILQPGAVQTITRDAAFDLQSALDECFERVTLSGVISTYYDTNRGLTAAQSQQAGAAFCAFRDATGPICGLYPELGDEALGAWFGADAWRMQTKPPHTTEDQIHAKTPLDGKAHGISPLNKWVYNSYKIVMPDIEERRSERLR